MNAPRPQRKIFDALLTGERDFDATVAALRPFGIDPAALAAETRRRLERHRFNIFLQFYTIFGAFVLLAVLAVLTALVPQAASWTKTLLFIAAAATPIVYLGLWYSYWQLVMPRRRFLPPLLVVLAAAVPSTGFHAAWNFFFQLPPALATGAILGGGWRKWLIGCAWADAVLGLATPLLRYVPECPAGVLSSLLGSALLTGLSLNLLLFCGARRAIDRLLEQLPVATAVDPAAQAEVRRWYRAAQWRIRIRSAVIVVLLLLLPLLGYVGYCGFRATALTAACEELTTAGFCFDPVVVARRFPASPAADQAVFDAVVELNRQQTAVPDDVLAAALDRWLAIPDWGWSIDWRAGSDADLPHLSALYQLGTRAAAAANAALARGDGAAARTWLARLETLVERAGRDDILISGLIAMSLEKHRIGVFRQAAANGGLAQFDSADLQRQITHARQLEARFAAARPRQLQMEAYFSVRGFQDPKKLATVLEGTEPPFIEWLPLYWRSHHGVNDRLFYLASIQAMTATAALDPYQIPPARWRRQARDRHYVYSGMLLDGLEKFPATAAGATAASRTFRTALAVELFRRQHHRLPDSLAELAEIPLDPFDGQPLDYEITPEGFTISSRGNSAEPIAFPVKIQP